MKKLIKVLVLLLTAIDVTKCLLFNDKTCCKDTGCFSKNPPFQDLPTPQCAETFGIDYTMYSRENPTTGEAFSKDVAPSIFRGERRTVFVVHGFVENKDYKWMTTIKDAFLAREDIQVVIVDWSGGSSNPLSGSSNPWYPQAASNTRTGGAYTALVIQNLLRQPNSDSSRMWCNGHSLGSHFCGHTGMRMPAAQKLGRVTGMDPAGPAFESSDDLTIGINPTSGSFVDIIHTSEILGNYRKLGHIDFFVTGHKLAGPDLSFQDAFELGIICGILCSHKRSVDFMISSLRGVDNCFATDQNCTSAQDLPASCTTNDSCVAYMGYRADQGCSQAGIYYVRVPPEDPFCPER